MNRGIVAAVAGGLGVCFIGYCFYFDRKRRSDPDFKRKLIESNFLISEMKRLVLRMHCKWENVLIYRPFLGVYL